MTKHATALFIAIFVPLAMLLGTGTCPAGEAVLYLTVDKIPSGLTTEHDRANVILDTVQAVRKELNEPDTLDFLPWARGWSMMSANRPTAIFPVFRTSEREGLYQWGGPIARIQWGLFQLADTVDNVDSLEEAREKGLTIGVFREDPRGRLLKSQGFSVEEANSVELNVSKLVHGRVQLIVFSWAAVNLLKTNPKFSDIALRAVAEFEPEDIYVAFSAATDPAYVQQWNAALNRLRRRGVIDRIWKDAGRHGMISPE